LLLAFKALRHKFMNNNNPTPYSREYIDHICSEEFLQLMERILDKKTRKPIDIWAIIKSYFSHYKKHSV
jgi:hypothetical protein